MEIPITNVLYLNNEIFKHIDKNFEFKKLNDLNLSKPNINTFPLLNILNKKINNTFFEIILVSLNDELVKRYLENRISYISLHKLLIKLLKKPYFSKYYKSSPNNINEIKNMVSFVKSYLKSYFND